MRSMIILTMTAACFGCGPVALQQDAAREPEKTEWILHPAVDHCYKTDDGRWMCPRGKQVEAEARQLLTSLAGSKTENSPPNLLDLPPGLRQSNWGTGSCAHAAIVDILRQHGYFALAQWWRSHHSGAYGIGSGVRDLGELGLSVAYTLDGREEFLEWCSRNRHGAAIQYDNVYGWRRGPHAVTFRGYADGYAYLQDNNAPDQVKCVRKDVFVRKWKQDGGNALTLVANPIPPSLRLP